VVTDSERAEKALAKLNEAVNGYTHYLDAYTDTLRPGIRKQCLQLRDEVDIKVTSSEAHIIRLVGVISTDAEYHIASAYFHASPGLWAIILGILQVVKAIIDWIKIINDILIALTDEGVVYWVNKLLPGFEDAWNNLLNGISDISQKLGWGVDGISHLLNAFSVGADTWGHITGGSTGAVRIEKIECTQKFLDSLSKNLTRWENTPGVMFDDLLAKVPAQTNLESWSTMWVMRSNIKKALERTETILSGVSGITHELGALREGMPAFIAQHIPQGLWDGIDRVQRTIDEGILPVMTDIGDRIDAVNAVLEAHRIKAEALAESLNNPGDLLERIEALSEQARLIQAGKLDKYAGEMLSKTTGNMVAGFAEEDRILDALHELMSVPIPEPSFLGLELAPGVSHPEITVEPHESWFVGDY